MKNNGWQNAAMVIAIIGFVGGIVLGISQKTFLSTITCWGSTFLVCLYVYGIGTIIEQNDIIIELMKNKRKEDDNK